MENIWTMGILVFLLAAIPQSFQDYSYDETWVTIDCGATNISWDEITAMAWETDDRYIKSGENKLVSTSTNRTELKTLRSFPGGLKNCYDLPLQKQSKYLLRAGFLYGNYDNLQKPPTFGLLVQGDMNMTVATSLSNDPVYHEFIFTTRKKGHVYVCLIQTQANQVPFISSLEATIVDEKAYRLMTKDTALYLQSRINYGANLTDPDHFAHHVDPYSRIWTPEQVPGYLNIDHGLGPMTWEVVENFPPSVVLDSAIVGTNASKSIFLPINFRERYQVSAYFVLYFDVSNVHQFVEETTTLDIFIDGQLVNITQIPNTPSNEGQAVVSICPVNVTGGMANLTISPAEGTTSPAFLNGLEVYSLMGISKAAQSTDLFAFQTFFGLVLFFLCVVL